MFYILVSNRFCLTLSPLIVQGFACVVLRVRHNPCHYVSVLAYVGQRYRVFVRVRRRPYNTVRSFRVWVRGNACVFVCVRRKPCQYDSVLACVGPRYRVRIRASAPQTLPIRFSPCVCGSEVSREYSCVCATSPCQYVSVLACAGQRYRVK